MSIWAAQSIYVVMFALGLGAITYEPAAIERGWPSGRLYQSDNNALKVVAFISIISAIVLTLWQLPWWYVFITVIAGYALMAALLSSLRSYFQWLPLSLFPLVPYAVGVIRVQ